MPASIIRVRDGKALLKTLLEHAKQKDGEGICRSVQDALNIGGSASYEIASEEQLAITLPGGECVVFLIVGSFILEGQRSSITGRGVGHVVQGSALWLQPETAVVIISGY